MKNLTLATFTLSVSLLATVAACGGDSNSDVDAVAATGCDAFVIPGGTDNKGFALPRDSDGNCQIVKAWSESNDIFTAQTIDLSCLNTPTDDVPVSVAGGVALATKTVDFQSGDPLDVATVTAFAGIDVGTPFDTQTSAANGDVTVTIPVGTTRFGFKVVRDQWFDTLLLNQYVEPDMAAQSLSVVQAVSQNTGTALPALVGVTRTPGKGILAGTIRDCAGNELSGVLATVSSTPGAVAHVAGSQTYYFGKESGLPERNTTLHATTETGLFSILEISPATTAYVQMWGILSDADLQAGTLTQLAELQVPVIGDVVITGSYVPLRN